MSRRQRKKEAAKQAAAPVPPSPAGPPRAHEDVLLGSDGLVDRIVRLGFARDRVLRALAVAVVRLCGGSPSPGYDAGHFFASLGEAMAEDAWFGADPRRYERCKTALHTAFYYGKLREQLKAYPLSDADRRFLRRWRN